MPIEMNEITTLNELKIYLDGKFGLVDSRLTALEVNIHNGSNGFKLKAIAWGAGSGGVIGTIISVIDYFVKRKA